MDSPHPEFTCNVCGAKNGRPEAGFAREAAHCAACGSNMRVRALIALLSQEIFGVPMALPEFPTIKAIRGIGMSDSPHLASRLADKFDYTNTFYHQAPFFDVTQPDERDTGRFDFILSSEVMEHVPPPVEESFANICRMLKRDGLLLMTTPYTIAGKTAEHYPDLYEYALASPGGKTVLVNRRRDRQIETFDNLLFHGGHGSTMEVRVFSEESLIETLRGAGFCEVYIATANSPEYGIEHAETWSLPIAARKGHFARPPAELVLQFQQASRRIEFLSGERDRLVGLYEQMKTESESRLQWGRKLEADFEERTNWALSLQQERIEAMKAFEHARKSEEEAWQCVRALEKELDETRSRKADLESRRWTKLGRRLNLVP